MKFLLLDLEDEDAQASTGKTELQVSAVLFQFVYFWILAVSSQPTLFSLDRVDCE